MTALTKTKKKGAWISFADSLKITDFGVETSSRGGKLVLHQQVLFFLSVCICHITYLPLHLSVSLSLSMSVFPSHSPTQARLQIKSKGWRVPRALPRRCIPFVELSNYRRVQTPDARTKGNFLRVHFPFIFVFSYHPKQLRGPWESTGSLTCLFLLREMESAVVILYFFPVVCNRRHEWRSRPQMRDDIMCLKNYECQK